MAWNLALFEALPRPKRIAESLLESQAAMHKRRRAQLLETFFFVRRN